MLRPELPGKQVFMKTTIAALSSFVLVSNAFALSASPSNLGGLDLCLSQKNTVTLGIEGAGKMDLKGIADRAYIQTKQMLQAHGVKFHEAAGCSDSASAFYLVFNATAASADGIRAFLVQGSVSDWTNANYQTYVDVWSSAHYGFADDSELTADLVDESKAVLGDFMNDWKAANNK